MGRQMNDTLKALAARIAATGRWIPRPGQAVRDPETGNVYRFVVRHDHPWCVGDFWTQSRGYTAGPTCIGIFRDNEEPANQVFRRALSAGPDLDDEVTVLSLLADLPDHELRTLDGEWCCKGAVWPDYIWPNTRAEAIALAWISAHEVNL